MISENRGSFTPKESRSLEWNDIDYLTLSDAELVKSLKEFISNYPNQEIDLAKINEIKKDVTVLNEVSEELNITYTSAEP